MPGQVWNGQDYSTFMLKTLMYVNVILYAIQLYEDNLKFLLIHHF